MDSSWIKSPVGRRLVAHWADPRATWLWSAEGERLVWRNAAARYFHGRPRKRDPKPAGEVIPLRGQIARLIRLGSANRPSLSRMQFVAGDRPISVTCACTPLILADGQPALLVVTVDPIGPDQLGRTGEPDAMLESLLPAGADYLLIDDDSQISGGSAAGLERYAPSIECRGLPPTDAEGRGALDVDGRSVPFTQFAASAQEASLLLFESGEPVAATPAEVAVSASEPPLPFDLPTVADAAPAPRLAVEPESPATMGLASLFDRLMDDDALYTPLTAADEAAPASSSAEAAAAASQPASEPPPPPPGPAGANPSPLVEAMMAEATPIHPDHATGAEQPAFDEAAEIVAATAVEAGAPAELVALAPVEPSLPANEPAPDRAASIPEAAAAEPFAAPPPATEAPVPPTLYRVVARQFTPVAEAATDAAEAEAPPVAAALGDVAAEIVALTDPTEPAPSVPVAAIVPSAMAGDLVPAPGGVAAEGPDAAARHAVEASRRTPEPEEDAAIGNKPEAPAATPNGDAAPEAAAELAAAPGEAVAAPEPAAIDRGTPVPVDAENVERVSRYNFDELSRILNDRVGHSGPAEAERLAALRAPAGVPSATPSGALVTLGGETLVLNRLPLGILVFRDQQILFANRAITEMTGYESVEALRQAGLAAIFPAGGEEGQEAGPVNHLVQRNGTLVPVTARLQSVSWQGRPALMLSASATEVRTGHEAAVKAFAEHLASARADGFLETSRAGVISYVSGDAKLLLKRAEEQLLGRPVSTLVAPNGIATLKQFLERPARFAETSRPAITLKGAERGVEIMLFAQGQAGVVSGYFGFVRQTAPLGLPAPAAPAGDADPALLGRLSRGVRRPLNTVIGFSDLIGSAAFGDIGNERYAEYARDIKTAGLEIAALVDELDDFARLRDGRYIGRPSDIDLAVLLDSIVTRLRTHANAARVLVRSAISERLPRIRADRASLAQAILNLLASAIGQTPRDGAVVLSAQLDDKGGIVVRVRDSGSGAPDPSEGFVVFRDGIGRDGQVLTPIRSSVGLALTRALLAVNQATLDVDPAGPTGTLFSLTLPAENVVLAQLPPAPGPEAAG